MAAFSLSFGPSGVPKQEMKALYSPVKGCGVRKLVSPSVLTHGSLPSSKPLLVTMGTASIQPAAVSVATTVVVVVLLEANAAAVVLKKGQDR